LAGAVGQQEVGDVVEVEAYGFGDAAPGVERGQR
jgi:hypothetical protein